MTKISLIAVIWVLHCAVYGQLPVNTFGPLYHPYYAPYPSMFAVQQANTQLNDGIPSQSGGTGDPLDTKTFSFVDTMTYKISQLEAKIVDLTLQLKATNVKLGAKAEQSALETTNKGLETTNKGLETTNKAVSDLNDKLQATNDKVAAKAEQSALETTNKGLETTNKAVLDLTDKLKATNDKVAAKAEQSALETTNKGLETTNNGLETTNKAVLDLTDKLKATNDKVAAKAEQSALETTNNGLETTNKAVLDLTDKFQVATSPNPTGKVPTSCGDLKTIGFVKSGIYSILDSKQVKNVYCDFTKTTNAELQKMIGTVNVKSTAVSFHAQLTKVYSILNTAVIFDLINVNVGTALSTSTGIFVAPTSGKYYFAYSGISDSGVRVRVVLQLSKLGSGAWTQIGEGFGDTTFKTFSVHATLDLVKTDQVRIIITEGRIHESPPRNYFNYVGWLMEENELTV